MATEKSTDYTPLIWLGGIYILADKLFGEGKEGKEDAKATEQTEHLELKNNPFEPGFTPPKAKEGFLRTTIQDQDLKKIVKKIEGGIGYVWDNEAQIMGGIKKARTKTDLWHISNYYSRAFKEDLYTSLKQNLNKKELGKVNRFVGKLPDYVEK